MSSFNANLSAILVLVALSGTAYCDQKVIQDGKQTWNGFTFLDGNVGQCISNWQSPVDWYNGEIHVKIEVSGKANQTQPTNLLFRLLNQHDKQHVLRIGNKKVVFEKNGTWYYTLQTNQQEPMCIPTQWSWTGPLSQIQMVIADSGGQSIDKNLEQASFAKECSSCRDFYGYPNTGLYFPVTIKYTYIAVSKGSKFVPPAGWGNDPSLQMTEIRRNLQSNSMIKKVSGQNSAALLNGKRTGKTKDVRCKNLIVDKQDKHWIR